MAFEKLASGEWFEGIAVDGDAVWYSDVFARGIRRFPPQPGDPVWRADDRWISGLMLAADGAVLSSGATGILRIDPGGGTATALVTSVGGVALPGVNEMVADAGGGLYFGVVDSLAFEQGTAPGPSWLAHVAPDGTTRRLTGDLRFSNGLALSPDGTWLYHCETFLGVFAYPVEADGALGERRLVLEKADCDGLKVDAEGRLWIAGYQSPELVIVTPEGAVAGTFVLPGPAATNHHFGGADGRDLYMSVVIPVPAADPAEVVVPATMDSGLWRGRAPVAGLPLHRPRIAPR